MFHRLNLEICHRVSVMQAAAATSLLVDARDAVLAALTYMDPRHKAVMEHVFTLSGSPVK